MPDTDNQQQPELLTVTPVSDWAIPTELVKLPDSGHVVKVRPFRMQAAIAAGRVPNALMPLLANAFGDDAEFDIGKVMTDPTGALDFLFWTVAEVLVEPRLYLGDGDVPEGHITRDHLADEDVNFLSNRALSPVAELTPFRSE